MGFAAPQYSRFFREGPFSWQSASSHRGSGGALRSALPYPRRSTVNAPSCASTDAPAGKDGLPSAVAMATSGQANQGTARHFLGLVRSRGLPQSRRRPEVDMGIAAFLREKLRLRFCRAEGTDSFWLPPS
ncbi:hypothetical protein NDU88_006930 [Pleurodeles waltl]|uniref:Uncharacterized protein n=1 Tax=Pleurodeles waltl TaxID=8319 RepID=A0AAV7LTA7_PLEWA|nr:hypothetical protein NDU88_006930 [Pleurodeles waltl]